MQIQIRSHSFDLSEPFTEGHICNPAEAGILNELRADYIRNSGTKMYDKLAQEGDKFLSPQALGEMIDYIARLEAKFKFKLRNRRPKNGTLEFEIEKFATNYAERLIRQGQGKEHDKDTLIDGLSKTPYVIGEAKKRLQQREAVAKMGLESLIS